MAMQNTIYADVDPRTKASIPNPTEVQMVQTNGDGTGVEYYADVNTDISTNVHIKLTSDKVEYSEITQPSSSLQYNNVGKKLF